MENLGICFNFRTSNSELMKRLEEFCGELELSTNEAIEIAIDSFLNDFNEIMALWTCRKALIKRPYVKPKPGDIF